MEAIQCKIQSRLHACSAESIAVGVSGYRYTLRTRKETYLTHTGELSFGSRCSPDVHVVRFWSRHSDSILGELGRRQTAPRDRYGWTRVYVRFQRDPRARSLVSESKSTFECARKHSKINDSCDIRRERVRADRQPESARLPACLPACQPASRRRRLRPRGNRGDIALCHFSLSHSAHCIRISLSSTAVRAVLRNY